MHNNSRTKTRRIIYTSERISIRRIKPEQPLVDRPINWRRKIFHWDEGNRIRAIKEAASLKDKRAVPVLIELLEQHVFNRGVIATDENERTLEEIISALSQIGIDDKLVDKSIQVLKTGNFDERRKAVIVLKASKDAKALPALVQALDDENVFVKIEAVSALKKLAESGIDCSSALMPLFQILCYPLERKRADPFVIEWYGLHLDVIGLLGDIKDKNAMLILKIMLQKHDERSFAAQQALVNQGLELGAISTRLSKKETREILIMASIAKLAEYGLTDERTRQELGRVVDFILENVSYRILKIDDAIDSIERQMLRTRTKRALA